MALLSGLVCTAELGFGELAIRCAVTIGDLRSTMDGVST
jgi:hypothetical protein